MEEVQILNAIRRGFGDVDSIHFVTGIVIPCIERKILALANLGLVKKTKSGFALDDTRVDKLEPNQVKKVCSRVSGKKILVVDDEDDIRLLIRWILEKNDMQVLEAVNGKKAMEVLEKDVHHEISCIITDYLMPQVNGLELCQMVRHEFKSLYKIFLITAYLDQERFEKAQCFDAKFMKPLNFDELIQKCKLASA